MLCLMHIANFAEKFLRRKNKARVNLKNGRFDNIDSAVIISIACAAMQNLAYIADDDS